MNLIFVGDSLTEFFDWQGRFPCHEVLNYGIAGETAEELYDRLDILQARARGMDYCFIMTGANNIAMGGYGIETAVRKIVKKVISWERTMAVVLQSVLPMALPWVDNGRIGSLNSTLAGIASEEGLFFLDVFSLFFNNQGVVRRNCLEEDGVHLSDEGYRIWSDAVESFLTEAG